MIDSAILLPFLTEFKVNPDYNSSDTAKEIDALIARNTAIEDCLLGIHDEQYLFDLLASDDIDPGLYVDAVEENITYLLSNPHELYC